MTQEEILEGNIKCAEFLQWSKAEQLEGGYCEWNEACGQIMPFEMKFHSDWNWLMGAVAKIGDICEASDIPEGPCYFETGEWESIEDTLPAADIESAFRVVVEFIDFYNDKNSH